MENMESCFNCGDPTEKEPFCLCDACEEEADVNDEEVRQERDRLLAENAELKGAIDAQINTLTALRVENESKDARIEQLWRALEACLEACSDAPVPSGLVESWSALLWPAKD